MLLSLNLGDSCATATLGVFFVFFFFRQGQKCSQQELGASALLTVALDDSLGQKATQVRKKVIFREFVIPMVHGYNVGFCFLSGLVRSVSLRARSLLTWSACSRTSPW